MKVIFYRLVTAVLLAGWMTVIFLFSAQPAAESDKVSGTLAYRVVQKADVLLNMDLTAEEILKKVEAINVPLRKAAHMTEYAIMGLLSFAFYYCWGIAEKRHYLVSLLTVSCYAATDEFHQLFVQGRSGQLKDVCIDTAGGAIGLLILYFVIKFVRIHCEKNGHPLQ